MTGVDDPESGDAVEILAALNIVESGAIAAIENAQIVAFELGPRQHVNPDVIPSRLLCRRHTTGLPVCCYGSTGLGFYGADLFGDFRSDHRCTPPGVGHCGLGIISPTSTGLSG